MTLPTGLTLYGALVSVGGVDCADATSEMTLTLTRETASVNTFGGKVSAAGSLGGSGNITIVYDKTPGSPFDTLRNQITTPTAGGVTCIFQPEGTGTGKETWTFNIVIGEMEVGGGVGDIQQGKFSFETTGAFTPTVQQA